MAKARRAWWLGIGSGLAAAALLTLGFVLFAAAATRDPMLPVQKADGIVALTGAQHRIMVGAKLLADGHAGRLLVTGVNRQTSSGEIRRLARLGKRLFDCCVDLGYEAQDTVGNAEETRSWATAHGFSSLIVVTSSYHMPRSLVELGRVMPEVRLIAYPVLPRQLRNKAWWTSPGSFWLLASEYLKFLPSAARFVVARLARTFEPRAVATAEPASRS
ncbi:MAG: YdcF family protein [Hyphomicrobiaceae bacterium]|nr:YdcF family protein [Hyphomicrobiaceae bacterium]